MHDRTISSVDDVVFNSERREAPLTIHLEVALKRRVDVAALVDAWVRAADAYPVAGAFLEPARPWDRARRWRVVAPSLVDNAVVSLTGGLAEVRSAFYSEAVSLVDCPAVTVGIWASEPGCHLLFRAHHGALDGRSLATIAEHMLSALGSVTANPVVPVATEVEDIPGSQSTRVASLRRVLGARTPARVVPSGGVDGPGYGLSVVVPDAHLMLALRDRAVSPLTVNDMLVGALHRTIASWNLARGGSPSEIRVTVPFDLRSGVDNRVGNLSSQLSTRSSEASRRDTEALLWQIHDAVAERRLGRTDPTVTAGSGAWMPLAVRRSVPRVGAFLTRDRFLDSSRLSNLGRLEGRGWEWPAITGVWFSVPTRMPQGVALGVVTHSGALRLVLRWCRSMFDDAAAEAFLECYVDELGRLVSEN